MYTKTRKELVLEHLPLVKKVANRIYRRIPEGAVEFEELVNTGVIGLIKAIERYDENRAKFSTYAYIKIRGEILDYLRKLDFLPRSVREKVKNGDLDDLKEGVASFISIEEKLFADSDRFTVKDTLASPDDGPEERMLLEDAKEKLTEAIKKLSEKEQLVLQLIFVEELDLKSIGEILGISVSRVSQIKSSALKKLRKFLEDSL
ncbi:sigma-70 family RNA polymerase sigma factor [Thermovibrio ammonificans]|jgi:RNA polymerase sigma factor for flagellar operon FliA|uniref:RNA polymerase, sigma 28 subunit, FliA/WhiG subfamily n=1 Tax=Thermovibrio ammonificans (strain DSM 15698 / JCM 12110 / HB-1) TaxID=648996 RepID=E8T489_THEA1|nr:sigma-70 family RNA polymerase sigma factor [Thermovibrio ammonificans]ADU97418.1 RNA polymerase, sigma 28 subunit, FliA/WhiG subfamily [Thermovibrio ammonificans HB-1]